MRTVMYAGGAYAWHSASAQLVVSMWLKMLCFTLARSRFPDEAWPDFIHRLRSKVLELTELFALPTILSTLMRLHASWTGHVVRFSMYSSTYVSLAWRDSRWWNAVKSNRDRPKHRLGGAQPQQPTDCFYSQLGPFWPLLSLCRSTWSEVCNVAFDAGAKKVEHSNPFGKLYHYVPSLSNKLSDFVGGCLPRTSARLPLVCISDCKSMVDLINGKSSLNGLECTSSLAIKRLRWLFYLLEVRLPFVPRLPEGLLVYRPREFNELADAVCTLIRKEQTNYFWISPELTHFPEGSFCYLYCDGGFDDLGRSSCGVVLQMHSADGSAVIIGAAGRRLACQNSFEAELEGALTACEFVIEVCKRTNLWLV